MLTRIKAIFSKLPRLAIKFYQCSVSGFFGHCCRFYPSCSNYADQAIASYGIVKGLWLTAWRLIRCNPWCHGGYDPIPTPNK